MRCFEWSVCIAAVVASGCLENELVMCPDGRACPAGTACDVANATCVAEGNVGLPSGTLDLLDVDCGTTATRSIIVSNPGTTAMPIAARISPSVLSIEPAEAIVPAGETITLTISLDAGTAYRPGEIAVGILTLDTESASVERVIRYSARGALVTANADLDLGEVAPNGAETRTFTLHNQGTTATELTIASISPPFELASSEPITLAPGAQRDVSVRLDPEGTVGDFSQTVGLTFSGNHCQPPPAELSLSGRATGDAVLASATFLAFETTGCGGPDLKTRLVLTSQSVNTQSLVVELLGDPKELTFTAPGSIGPSPATAVIELARPSIEAPHATGTFQTVLQITASEGANTIVKQVPVQYILAAPVVSASTSTMNLNGLDTVDLRLTNTGNGVAIGKLSETSRTLAAEYEIKISPDEFFLGEQESLDVKVGSDTPVRPGQFGPEGLPVWFEVDGACAPPETITFFTP